MIAADTPIRKKDLMTASALWAFDAYQRIRPRLPVFSAASREPEQVRSLADLADRFDGFVFDAFGVLNVGDTAVPGARKCFHDLQAQGKRCLILSNAATAPERSLVQKYRNLGFAITQSQLISSRMLVSAALACQSGDWLWAVMAPPWARSEQLPCRNFAIADLDNPASRQQLDNADAILMLSAQGWTDARQQSLEASLAARPRPVWVANPDLVAPREEGLTMEPGHYAHQLADRTGVAPVFFGKPFPNAFEAAKAKLSTIPAKRLLMVGDTLHTDVLGGACAGLATLLVTAHGSLKGLDVNACIAQSGIYPDFVASAV